MDDVALEREALRLFEALTDIPEADREGWIAARTAGNEALAGRLRSLLAAERRASLSTGGAWLSEDTAELPARIGAYRITGLIGRGGMGTVYRGERDSGDFDHVVAVKVIKPGLLSDALAERFRRERQTLAQLSHPHIAQLFDGGETDEGAPYIVMEFVPGFSLLRWVEETAPSRAERLRMFGAICRAVGFAHRSLVVHRDLTPSNVLVTPDGSPKLIDFGIARAPDLAPSTDGARAPSIGSLSLTPGYAAPERMTSAAVSTSTDIYSLGKLLGWLVDDKSSELRAIIAKATADDPNDRYATAESLAEDVEAWATGYPVSAVRRGPGYIFAKFVGRNRLPIAAAALTIALLLAALVYALVANHRAQIARADAETRFNDVRALANYMLFDLNGQLARVPGNTAARAALADQAQRYLASLAATPGASADLQLETARGLLRLAQIQGVPNEPNLGERDNALANLRRADQLLTSRPGEDAHAAIYRGLSALYRGLIEVHGKADQKAARASLAQAEASLASVAPAGRDDEWVRAMSALRIAQLEFLDVAGERAGLASLIERARKERQGWTPAQRDSFSARADEAMLLYYEGLSLGDTDYEKALAVHLEAEKRYDALLEERRDDPLLLYRAAWNGLDGFAAGSRAGIEHVSDRLIRRAAQVIDRLALIDDRDDAVRALQMNIKEALSQNLRDAGAFEEAIAAAQQVVALRKAAAEKAGKAGTTNDLGNLGFSQMVLGVVARDGGQRPLACAAWRDALASLRTAEKAEKIIGFHQGFIPGIEAHVKACANGGPIDFPMR
ncbi:serine/threonine-protein kinase [Sphingobium lignivorans]|uniref:Serine/threonine-protein kinase n=1 Tax=Sphingobium lignivorans TaxID=2735886 RepID=A0ABR6NGW7_9SPHN|nr:serine/threonine-protein kinase [Sphingobium lignivorans]MBB5985748.1 serine/threonine-protein kinase [Sphingobium lignivorans]